MVSCKEPPDSPGYRTGATAKNFAKTVVCSFEIVIRWSPNGVLRKQCFETSDMAPNSIRRQPETWLLLAPQERVAVSFAIAGCTDLNWVEMDESELGQRSKLN